MHLEALHFLLIFALTLEAAGVGISALLVVDARRDYAAVEALSIGNGRRTVARSAVITESFRLAALLCLSISSAASTVNLWDLPPSVYTTPLYVAMIAFEVAAVLIVAQSITVYMTRRKLFDAYQHALDEKQPVL